MAQFVNGSQWISHMDRGPDLDKAIRARLKLYAWNPSFVPFDHDHRAQVAEAAVRMCIVVLRVALNLVPSTAAARPTIYKFSITS